MNPEMPHESAIQHVTGEAVYIGDMHPGDNVLVGHVVYSPLAYGRIIRYDLSDARKVEGVHAVMDYTQIPGSNELNPQKHDEPCLSEGIVNCIGQAIFLIAAQTKAIAIEAEQRIIIEYEPLEPILSIEDAIEKDNRLIPPRVFEVGDPERAMENATHRLQGTLHTGAQEHWYLEGQAAVCVPGENREMTVYASSQHPTETQMVVAEVLGLKANEVVCEVKRMGGGFGGKETQANQVAAWAALLADATRKPVKLQLFRDDDQKITGKRHRFLSNYSIGFDQEGRILAYIVDFNADAGWTTDLSIAIMERAMFHAENAYYIPNARITGNIWKTNLPSNTAFRGFGGPQGMAVIENAIDRVARYLNKDAAAVRHLNFYTEGKNNMTPYGQKVEHIRLQAIWEKIHENSAYSERRKSVDAFNQKHETVKRGLACTPVKFGISFTTAFLNQAGALVLLYNDGSILVNHGGTEMGQGLHTKILMIASKAMGIGTDKIRINATNTSKVPNTSPTAASSGTDLNGMAVKDAIEKLRSRLSPCARLMLKEQFDIHEKEEPVFEKGLVFYPGKETMCIPFEALASRAHIEQISLSATGYYSTPEIYFDRVKGKGRPFNYYAYGMAVSEVEVDMLTGYSKVLATHIVQDVGDSINQRIDMGQVYGGFIQGMGWCTTETIRWDEKGNLLNHSPGTYKIPTIGDTPLEFHAELLWAAPNPRAILRSKAVGEPPLMLALSVWLAIKDAISSVGNHLLEPTFNLPANNEMVVLSVRELKERLKGKGIGKKEEVS